MCIRDRAKGTYSLVAPKVIKVELKGKLQPWTSAKDVILYVLQQLSVKGGVGKIVEYTGEGVKSLSVTDRATIDVYKRQGIRIWQCRSEEPFPPMIIMPVPDPPHVAERPLYSTLFSRDRANLCWMRSTAEMIWPLQQQQDVYKRQI